MPPRQWTPKIRWTKNKDFSVYQTHTVKCFFILLDLKPNLIPFRSKSIGNWLIQSDFGFIFSVKFT